MIMKKKSRLWLAISLVIGLICTGLAVVEFSLAGVSHSFDRYAKGILMATFAISNIRIFILDGIVAIRETVADLFE